jgi:hypothetical protein
MSERIFDGGTFNESCRKVIKDFFKKRGENVKVGLSAVIGLRRQDGNIYAVDYADWQTGHTVVRFARIKKDGEEFLIGCDILLGDTASGRNPDRLIELIAWDKPDISPSLRRFPVREFWSETPSL